MTYIEIVRKSIEYIEKNLNKTLSLDELASTFYITKFHYSRIFKAVTGMSIMNYYKQRKFSRATEDLIQSEKNILEIAFDYGYNSQEAFSRAYKKYFGCTPKLVKSGKVEVELFPKFKVIERNFTNYKNAILSEHSILEMNALVLRGADISVNFSEFNKHKKGMDIVHEFVGEIEDLNEFYVLTFSSTSTSNSLDLGMYISHEEIAKAHMPLQKLTLPHGKFLKIQYIGKMEENWKNVTDDVRMIIKSKNLHWDNSLINFYQKFSKENKDTNVYNVYVPLK